MGGWPVYRRRLDHRPTKRNLGHLVCSMVSTEKGLVEQFDEWWPGYMKPATGLRPNQNPAWVWVIAARRAEGFLLDVLPYLNERTWTRAQWALRFQGQKTLDTRLNRTPEYLARQWQFYETMKVMNQRGTCPKAEEFRKGRQ